MHLEFLDPRHLIETYGYLGVFLIIFAECGLFFGFFLPGDSLLLTAGLFAYKGFLDIGLLLPLLYSATILGDSTGYWIGRKAGRPLFDREGTLLFRRKNLLAAKAFYERHGGKTVIMARFMPFIRTFAPMVAGAVEMPYKRFLTFSIIGGLVWAVGVTLAGYWLGSLFPPETLDRYFLIIVAIVIVLSVTPSALHVWKESRGRG